MSITVTTTLDAAGRVPAPRTASDFTERIKQKHLRAIKLCAKGTPDVTISVSARDFCALMKILYGCYLKELDDTCVDKTSEVQP